MEALLLRPHDRVCFAVEFLSPRSNLPPLPAGARPLLLNCGRGHYLPGEAQRGEWEALAPESGSPPWAVDAWGLGCLVAEAFAGQALPATAGALRDAAALLPPELVKDYQRLLASSPARRLNPSALADSPALRTPPVRALAFLDSLAVRDATEKDAFFRGEGSGFSSSAADSLAAALPRFPPIVAQRRLLPALGAAVEFGGAPPSAVPPLISIATSLDDAAFLTSAAPLLARLFRCSADRGVRRCLLEGVPSFGARLPAALVEGEVYPALTGTATGGGSGGGNSSAAAAGNALGCGFSDPSPYIRELTLKAMLTLAPKLQPRTLSQGLLKHLARAQVDAEGGIRANTTILLGNLAPLLDAATIQRGVLLNAFARALRDPFPPARAAGAAALASALHMHSPADVAAKGLPALAPVCADGDGRARRAALAAVDAVVAILRKNAAALDEKEAREEAEARAKGTASAAQGAPPPTGGTGPYAPAPARAAPDVPVVPPRPQAPLLAAARRPSSGASGGGGGSAPSSSRRSSISAAAASNGGWDDDGGDDFSGDGGRATGHVAPPAADFGDDDDDEWESMDAPAPPPPRPRPVANGRGARRGGGVAGGANNAARGGGGLKLGRSGASAAAAAAAAPTSAASRFSDLQL